MTYAIKAVFFISLLGVSIILYRVLLEQKLVHSTISKIYRHAKDEARLRLEKEKRYREEEGRKEKIYFLQRMDLLIEQSGITKKISFMNTGIYLFMSVGFIIIVTTSAAIISHSSILTLFLLLMTFFISYLILYIMSGNNYKNTEKNILEFANLLENYSKTNDDIITILNKVYPYLNNPLHDAVEECVFEARGTGNVSKALLNLESKIELEKFKEIIRNIEISSRYEANYEEIIKDSRKMLREYISAREERRALIKNSRIEMAIIIFCCLFIINMLDSFSSISVFHVLFHSLIGNILLGYCLLVLFGGFWVLLAIDK